MYWCVHSVSTIVLLRGLFLGMPLSSGVTWGAAMYVNLYAFPHIVSDSCLWYHCEFGFVICCQLTRPVAAVLSLRAQIYSPFSHMEKLACGYCKTCMFCACLLSPKFLSSSLFHNSFFFFFFIITSMTMLWWLPALKLRAAQLMVRAAQKQGGSWCWAEISATTDQLLFD